MKNSTLNWKALGIINITPDSFSDGGEILDERSFSKKLFELKNNKIKYFDIGAESTAPFNSSILVEEEWRRFEKYFIPNLEYFEEDDVLSIDTYKLDIIERLCDLFNEKKINNKLIWNDVSGDYNSSVKDVLSKNKQLKYVYSHNLVPSRELTSKHMDYVLKDLSAEEFLISMKKYFHKVKIRLESDGLLDRVVFDPCFGFSKTREQNHLLIKELSTLISEFPKQQWMIGISRKSFLRGLGQDKDGLFSAELAHVIILERWRNQFECKNCLIRLHDSKVFNTLMQCQKMFKLP
jgi:dihydropteroate synthase